MLRRNCINATQDYVYYAQISINGGACPNECIEYNLTFSWSACSQTPTNTPEETYTPTPTPAVTATDTPTSVNTATPSPTPEPAPTPTPPLPTEYYVSGSSGDDSNSGSFNNPWKTIQHAVNSVQGTADLQLNIYVAPAIYDENVVLDSYEALYNWDKNFVLQMSQVLDVNLTLDMNYIHANMPVIDANISMSLKMKANSKVDGFYITGSDGIIANASNLSIRQCIIDNTKQYGINASGNYISIESCIVLSTSYYGIRIAGNNNEVSTCIIDSANWSSVRYEGSANIKNNYLIADSSSGGISGFYGSPIIEENVIQANGTSGMSLGMTDYPIIRKNLFYGNGSYGVHVWSNSGGFVTIENNYIPWNFQHGIRLEESPAQIANNLIYTNSHGIVIEDTEDWTEIFGNTIAYNFGSGVYVENSNVKLNHNIIAFNGSWGIEADVDSTVSVKYSCFYGNPDGNFTATVIADVNTTYYADPLFVEDASGNPFYLSHADLNQSVNSPCIDAGDPDITPSGWTRTDGQADTGIIDLGFHYWEIPNPTLPDPEGD